MDYSRLLHKQLGYRSMISKALVVIIIALLVLGSLTNPFPVHADNMIIGTDVVGDTDAVVSYVIANQFTANTTDTMSYMKAYCRTNSNVRLAIYSDDGADGVGNLLAESASTAITSGDWRSVTVGPVALTNGTKYWLALQNQTAGGVAYIASAGQKREYKAQAYGAFPADGTGWTADTGYLYSLQGWAVPVPSVPVVTTSATSNVEETTATFNGNITDGVNIDIRGFAYGTTCNATQPGSAEEPPASYTSNWSEYGSFGTGAYSSTGNITGLTSATCYCVRAYTHNATGWGWAANEDTFLTKPLNPTNLTCTAGDGFVGLTWTKATGGAGVTVNTIVRYLAGAVAPSDITGVGDGSTLTYNGTLATATQGGLANCQQYTFAAWTQIWGCTPTLTQYSDNPPDTCSATPSTAAVLTLHCTGFSSTWAVVNGSVTATPCGAAYTQRGFDYGVSTAYGSESLEIGTWTTATSFNRVLTSLSPATVYHYRAKILVGATWYYGTDRVFSTSGSPSKYEYLEDASTGDSYITATANWTYQTFTTNMTSIGHSVTSIWLNLRRVGNPGDVVASIKHTSNSTQGQSCWSYPTGTDLTSGALDGNAFTTAYTWYEFEVPEVCLSANTTYAIVLRAVGGDATNYVLWAAIVAGTYIGGNAGYSLDSGSSWTGQCLADNLFQIWGNPCINVEDAKVFNSFIEDDDWLITLLYRNFYEPYYSDGTDVRSMFYIQLTDSSGTLLAQTRCPDWGYRPGCIYLNANQVTSLEWEYPYRVRLYGDFSDYPYMEYVLQPEDWMGADLNRLDSWVIGAATLIEDYYGVTLTINIANKGLVLNEDGGVIFDTGIPSLSAIRPGVFQIVTTSPGYERELYTQEEQQYHVWETLLGPYITSLFGNWGTIWSVSGSTIGAFVAFAFYAVVAVFAFPVGGAIAAVSIPFGILVLAWYTGLIPMAAMGVILALAAFLMIWQFWLKGAG